MAVANAEHAIKYLISSAIGLQCLHTGINSEGRTTKVKSKQDTICADGDTTPHPIVVVDLIPIIVKFVCGGKQVSEEDASVVTPVINTRILECLDGT